MYQLWRHYPNRCILVCECTYGIDVVLVAANYPRCRLTIVNKKTSLSLTRTTDGWKDLLHFNK